MEHKDTDSAIRNAAIAAVQFPEHDCDKQLLNPHEIKYADDKPQIEDIIIDKETGKAQVYFPVVDESYFIVVYVDIQPSVRVRIINASAGNRVNLFVESKDHTAEELVSMLGLPPDKQWSKGDFRPSRSNRKIPYSSTGLIIEPNSSLTGEVKDKLSQLINYLIPNKKEIIALSKEANVEIQIAYFGYKDEMWGINFNNEIVSKIAEMNLAVDVDMYASGPDLEEC